MGDRAAFLCVARVEQESFPYGDVWFAYISGIG